MMEKICGNCLWLFYAPLGEVYRCRRVSLAHNCNGWTEIDDPACPAFLTKYEKEERMGMLFQLRKTNFGNTLNRVG
jgi:hypothetical protein